MALTIAHTEGRREFAWRDIVEAMTTVETGTAQNIEYIQEETRAVAIHEAGHAAASHVYLGKDVESTRLSIRKRGGSLGHHMSLEKEERFSHFRSYFLGRLIVVLGAMAAEHVFYKENSAGVCGDVQSATALAAMMVGSGHGPRPGDDRARPGPARSQRRGQRRGLVRRRLERIGDADHEPGQRRRRCSTRIPLGAVLGDGAKRAAAAELLGPGVRHRLRADGVQPRCAGADRRRAGRAQGAARRRGRASCWTASACKARPRPHGPRDLARAYERGLRADRSADDGTVGAGCRALRAQRVEPRRRPRAPRPHAERFRAVTAVLVALGIGAIVVAVSVAVRAGGRPRRRRSGPRGSRPTGGTLGAQDIADFVAPVLPHRQRQSARGGHRGQPGERRGGRRRRSRPRPAAPLHHDGQGSRWRCARAPPRARCRCSAATRSPTTCAASGARTARSASAQPSTNRLLLLRREALELALYTFKYISGTQNVVAILPPGHTQPTATLSKKPPSANSEPATPKPVDIAVLFVRQELSPLLDQPLSAILPEEIPADGGADAQRARGRAGGPAHRPRPVLRAAPAGSGRLAT